MADVPARTIPPGVSGDLSPRRQAIRDARERVANAGNDWPLSRALELRRRALEVGSAQAAAEFRLPIGRVLPVLAAHGLDLKRPPESTWLPAQAPAPKPQAAPGGPAASRPAREPGPGPGRAPGRRGPRSRWTAEVAAGLHATYLEKGAAVAAAAAGITTARLYQVLEQHRLPRLSRGQGVHRAAERRQGRVPAGVPRGSVGCPRCGHVFIPDRPTSGLEE